MSLTEAERFAHGRRADSFPAAQIVYSLTDVEMLLRAKALDVKVDRSGRPSSDRDGACTCDYNPETTEGPVEDCPFHGRPYSYWVERADTSGMRLEEFRTKVSAFADDLDGTVSTPVREDLYRSLAREIRILLEDTA